MACRHWEQKHTGVEVGLGDEIPRRAFMVLFRILFLELGDDEWTDGGNEFL